MILIKVLSNSSAIGIIIFEVMAFKTESIKYNSVQVWGKPMINSSKKFEVVNKNNK